MAGIKNRGSQIHADKTKYKRNRMPEETVEIIKPNDEDLFIEFVKHKQLPWELNHEKQNGINGYCELEVFGSETYKRVCIKSICIFQYCNAINDWGLQLEGDENLIFGSVNRLVWDGNFGFRPSIFHCNKSFVDNFFKINFEHLNSYSSLCMNLLDLKNTKWEK